MEAPKFEEIKIKSALIEQLFKQLEKLIKHELKDMTPFKGGLPVLPRVVGLISKLPDGVNNLVWGFVGCQSKAAKAIEEERGKFLKFEEARGGYNLPPGVFTEWLKHKAKFKLEFFVRREGGRLVKMRKMTERREAFTKLRPWLRQLLVRYDAFYYGGLFSSNRKNEKFIEDQIEELGMRQEMHSRRQLRNRFRSSLDW